MNDLNTNTIPTVYIKEAYKPVTIPDLNDKPSLKRKRDDMEDIIYDSDSDSYATDEEASTDSDYLDSYDEFHEFYGNLLNEQQEKILTLEGEIIRLEAYIKKNI